MIRLQRAPSLATLLAPLLVACIPAQAPQGPSYCYDEALLKVRYATCVKHAATRAESDACADDVDAACGWAPTRGKR